VDARIAVNEDKTTHAKLLQTSPSHRVIPLSENVEVKVVPPTAIASKYSRFAANGLTFQCEAKQNDVEIRLESAANGPQSASIDFRGR
jgi:hypothetical protein